MSKQPMDPMRRKTLHLVMGAVSIPLAGAALLRGRQARAAELEHLTEDNATAKALQYVHDATQAKRTDKSGTAAADQFCHNCQFLQGDDGQWRPCQLFPGKSVNADGWCVSWTPKA